MATAKQPKSILKKSSYPATPSATSSSTKSKSKEERDYEVALYHANLIQQRKDIELKILFSTEELIDYPLAKAPYDASNPSPADAKSFKEHLRPFQSSDYDALILERNINEHCGYTLCPRNRVKVGGGKHRILGMNGNGFRVVERADLEKWCSPECGKRALYVKVQLSETAAWERNAWEGRDMIDLLDEPKTAEATITEGIDKMDLDDDDASQQKDSASLALERGDQSSARSTFIDIRIQEKEVSKPAQAPSFQTNDIESKMQQLHLMLEGHTSNFEAREGKIRTGPDGEEYDDSDEDTDFKMI